MQAVVVTGATGGIGGAVVTALLAAGRQVVACGTNEAKLAAFAARPNCESLRFDLGQTEAVSSALSERAVDVVIHTAAKLGRAAKLHELSSAEIRDLVEINLMGTFNLVHAVLPGMVARRRGHIVLCGSIAARHPGLSPAVYGATKAAVASLAADLRYELLGTSIRITEIVPGRVRTGMHDQLKPEHGLYSGYSCVEPEDVAAATMFAINMPPHVDITTLEVMPTDQAVGGATFHRSE